MFDSILERADDSAIDSVWVTDHVAVPRERSSRYPYTTSGEFRSDVSPDSPWLECTTALAWALSRTRRVSVGTAIIVLPARQPVLLAKQLSTLSFLVGCDRIVLGVGAGWLKEEIQALDMSAASLAGRMEESVAVMRWAWAGAAEPFHGTFRQIPPLHFSPRIEPNAVPIIVGGHGPRALKFAAEHGDGWLPSHLSSDDIRAGVAEITRQRHGSDQPGSLRVVARPGLGREPTAALVDEHREAGVTDLILDIPYAGGVGEALAHVGEISQLAKEYADAV
jgi:alkanesulfonate monooxygenase SsuD/methylene tetrahydromethanopterin reductase-like flavin-dependent oxidoreductase (luciferase family)